MHPGSRSRLATAVQELRNRSMSENAATNYRGHIEHEILRLLRSVGLSNIFNHPDLSNLQVGGIYYICWI